MTEKFKELADADENVNAYKTGLAYTINSKPFSGLAEKRFCEGIGTVNGTDVQATSFQGYPELMTIRHMDFDDVFKTIYIGIVSDK